LRPRRSVPLCSTLSIANDRLMRSTPRRSPSHFRKAGVPHCGDWVAGNEGRHTLIAVARHLAAQFPTARAHLQTADMAPA
jgi:hypothetical protein